MAEKEGRDNTARAKPSPNAAYLPPRSTACYCSLLCLCPYTPGRPSPTAPPPCGGPSGVRRVLRRWRARRSGAAPRVSLMDDKTRDVRVVVGWLVSSVIKGGVTSPSIEPAKKTETHALTRVGQIRQPPCATAAAAATAAEGLLLQEGHRLRTTSCVFVSIRFRAFMLVGACAESTSYPHPSLQSTTPTWT